MQFPSSVRARVRSALLVAADALIVLLEVLDQGSAISDLLTFAQRTAARDRQRSSVPCA